MQLHRWLTTLSAICCVSWTALLGSANGSSTEDPYATYRDIIRSGRYLKANRTTEAMITEAQTFLDKMSTEYPQVGLAVGVVAKDQLMMKYTTGLLGKDMSTSPIDNDTIFQVGSFSKTFIALGIGLLVDDGKMQWTDPVVKHLPWFELPDKYMQEHMTVADALAMNTGFGAYQGDHVFYGLETTERQSVERLQYLEPAMSLRPGFAYANINTLIAGQVIEAVSNMSWGTFLTDRVFAPLNMTRTFPSIHYTDKLENIAQGHYQCDKKITRPYDMLRSPRMGLSYGFDKMELAAGSIVSTVTDMGKFMRLMLSNGTVDGVTILQDPMTLVEMTRSRVGMDVSSKLLMATIGYAPTVAVNQDVSTGYGLDLVGHLVWDRAFYSKGGDTIGHRTRNLFLPDEEIAVITFTNTQGSGLMPHQLVATFIAGIFMDIPEEHLKAEFDFERERMAILQDEMNSAGYPIPEMECSAIFYDVSKTQPIPHANDWVGQYEADQSTKFYGQVDIRSTETEGTLHATYGLVEGLLRYVAPIPKDSPSAQMFDNSEAHVFHHDTEYRMTEFWTVGHINGVKVVMVGNLPMAKVTN